MTRCEGWRRYGGAFTLGPVRWEQCPNEAVVLLEIRQKGVHMAEPACMECWKEAMQTGIEVVKAIPIPEGWVPARKEEVK